MTETTYFKIDPSRPGIWVVTFSNPPINMLSPSAIHELQGLLTAAEAKPGLKVLIFDSADETFFIAHFDTNAAASRPVTVGTEPPWTDFVTRLSRSPLISIARVRGRARGVGNEFILACDLRYGSRQRAVFGNPEVGVGVVPGGGALEWLPRAAGRTRALEVLVSGADYDAETAERFGWLTRALDDHELDFFVDDLARRVASFDSETLAAIKAQVNRYDLPTAEEIQSSNQLFWHGLGTPASQARRARLGPLGYGEHSHFEINFGARLPEIQPGFEGSDPPPGLSQARTMDRAAAEACFRPSQTGDRPMSVHPARARPGPHPVHAILLSFPIALFTAAVATDIAYLRSAEIQWSNFSAWLITGALSFGGPVVAWGAVALVARRRSPGRRRRLCYLVVVLLMWIAGLINAFKHSQDGWSSVGSLGLSLSILSAALAILAGVIACSGIPDRKISQ